VNNPVSEKLHMVIKNPAIMLNNSLSPFGSKVINAQRKHVFLRKIDFADLIKKYDVIKLHNTNFRESHFSLILSINFDRF